MSRDYFNVTIGGRTARLRRLSLRHSHRAAQQRLWDSLIDSRPGTSRHLFDDVPLPLRPEDLRLLEALRDNAGRFCTMYWLQLEANLPGAMFFHAVNRIQRNGIRLEKSPDSGAWRLP